jgi:hypothetical protein
MGNSSSHAKHSTKTSLLVGALDRISEAQMETLEILSDVTQMTQLMTSLLEAKSGQIVSFESAFADC